jgi:hypothetical protein
LRAKCASANLEKADGRIRTASVTRRPVERHSQRRGIEMRKWVAIAAWIALACSPALAQQGPKQPVPKVPVVEVFGGYAFARFDTGGSATNGNGVMGSFGWNARRWLQIVADSSYNTGTTNGVKNVLYGNHFGPRFFYRPENHLGLTPFAELLVGGSHVTTTVGGTGGIQASDNGFSMKGGGGIDLNLSPHFAARLFDADYYRTPFFGRHQNTIWITAGFVIRFGGARPE